jgi:L-asparaginase II
MPVMNGPVAIKHGADGVYTAILPERRLGVALKVADGSNFAAEIAMAALLVRLGVADRAHPMVEKWLRPGLLSRRGIPSGFLRPAEGFYESGRAI